MSFEWPLALLTLLLVPLALGAYLIVQRRPPKYAVAFPNLGVLATVVGGGGWRRWVPPALFLLALGALGIAMARPHVSVTVQREQATIVLAIDSSGSMRAEDVAPTRMAAAQAAVRSFLDGLPPKFRVGMVTFAGEAQVVAPPSTDRELVLGSLDYLIPLRGTAIGDAVARAAEVARRAVGPEGERELASVQTVAPAPPKVEAPAAVLLLSDGFQTAGLLAAARRRRAGEGARHPRLLDRARHGRGRPRPQLRRRGAPHPRAARPCVVARDRRGDRRQVLRRAECRGTRGRVLRPWIAARGRARAGRGDVRVPRRRGGAGAARRRARRAVVQPDSLTSAGMGRLKRRAALAPV